MSSLQPAQRPQNYFTHNIAITPASTETITAGSHIRNLPFLVLYRISPNLPYFTTTFLPFMIFIPFLAFGWRTPFRS